MRVIDLLSAILAASDRLPMVVSLIEDAIGLVRRWAMVTGRKPLDSIIAAMKTDPLSDAELAAVDSIVARLGAAGANPMGFIATLPFLAMLAQGSDSGGQWEAATLMLLDGLNQQKTDEPKSKPHVALEIHEST